MANRSVLICAAMALVASIALPAPHADGGSPSPADAPAGAEARDKCPDVYLIGVRGTLQEAGLGREVRTLFRRIERRLDGSGLSTRRVAVNYPATFVSPPYKTSVRRGVRVLERKMEAIVANYGARCGGAEPSIIVAGFSQGAQVIRKALPRIDDPARDSVIGVGLVGDPKNTPTDAIERLPDSAHHGTGVLATAGSLPIAEWATEATASLCEAILGEPDSVCNQDASLPSQLGIEGLALFRFLVGFGAVHTTVYDAATLGPLGVWLADKAV